MLPGALLLYCFRLCVGFATLGLGLLLPPASGFIGGGLIGSGLIPIGFTADLENRLGVPPVGTTSPSSPPKSGLGGLEGILALLLPPPPPWPESGPTWKGNLVSLEVCAAAI
mmetsp:Transcript_37174/g.54468  ORF Transcript_37174/g.54468 Transcript_37174/m.54468 type:complete len:112 (+) Transcript_37174:181-516(+)